ncbi:hypothetical protein [Campylobacter concisus]|uniref:hypothetical protein n=1 Tax=Campylobacter concisus TaxID=199 RepID=UPI00131E586F|nr:hypothetical protein [Campylobacter concisus]
MNYGLLAVASLRSKAVPLSPFLNPPIPSHVRGACSSASHCMQLKNYGKFYLSRQISIRQILKFHGRVISALKFELSAKRSQILVVNSCE